MLPRVHVASRRLAPLVPKRTVISSSMSPLNSGNRSAVDNERDYDQKHRYPQPGQYMQSNTEPNPVVGRPIPLNVMLTNYAPMKHPITYGQKVCDLQIRSFFTGDLDFFCDFILRVAFYLKIPVKGVTPLPRKTERWTVIRSPFVHAKSKENFERRTHKRVVKLYDANPEVVQVFLATVRKYCISGVGMKATMYQSEDLDVLKRMDAVEDTQNTSLMNDNDLAGVDSELADAVQAILDSPEFKPIMEEHEKRSKAKSEDVKETKETKKKPPA